MEETCHRSDGTRSGTKIQSYRRGWWDVVGRNEGGVRFGAYREYRILPEEGWCPQSSRHQEPHAMKHHTLTCIVVLLGMSTMLHAQQIRRGGTPPTAQAPEGTKAMRDLAYVKDGHER